MHPSKLTTQRLSPFYGLSWHVLKRIVAKAPEDNEWTRPKRTLSDAGAANS